MRFLFSYLWGMNKRRITLIFILVGLSLAGIIAVQAFWIRNALQVKEAQLDASVNEALNSLVRKLEKRKVVLLARELDKDSLVAPTFRTPNVRRKGHGKPIREESEIVYTVPDKPVTLSQKSIKVRSKGKGKSSVYFFSDSVLAPEGMQVISTVERINVDSIEAVIADAIHKSTNSLNATVDNNHFKMEWIVNELGKNGSRIVTHTINSQNDDSVSGRAQWLELVRNAYKNKLNIMRQIAVDADASKLPLEKRVDFKGLEKMVDEELTAKGVSPTAKICVTSGAASRMVFASAGYDSLYGGHIYKTALFPENIIPLTDTLHVYLPLRRRQIYSSAFVPGVASLVFTLIMVITFYLSLRTIVRQKKLADMKADFINNMTHELKTPIATIRLAVDSIENAKTISNPDNIKYFTAAIRDENFRMNRMVEQVLQAARLERKELRLVFTEINFGVLVESVVAKMQIMAKERGGFIRFEQSSDRLYVLGDQAHLESMVTNLIDNAIKYSAGVPQVTVFLGSSLGEVVLTVEDTGIGMSRDEQRRVFEKFYRVPHGNVHNVKGFGLGLSYVKEVVELHGGVVKLKSEQGRGSSFSVFIPERKANNE